MLDPKTKSYLWLPDGSPLQGFDPGFYTPVKAVPGNCLCNAKEKDFPTLVNVAALQRLQPLPEDLLEKVVESYPDYKTTSDTSTWVPLGPLLNMLFYHALKGIKYYKILRVLEKDIWEWVWTKEEDWIVCQKDIQALLSEPLNIGIVFRESKQGIGCLEG